MRRLLRKGEERSKKIFGERAKAKRNHFDQHTRVYQSEDCEDTRDRLQRAYFWSGFG
jgi:hypothetical protein